MFSFMVISLVIWFTSVTQSCTLQALNKKGCCRFAGLAALKIQGSIIALKFE
jgi:hypothetical protein